MENEFVIKRDIEWVPIKTEDLKVGDFIKIDESKKDYMRIKEIRDDKTILVDRKVYNNDIHVIDGVEDNGFEIENDVIVNVETISEFFKSKRNDIVELTRIWAKEQFLDNDSVFQKRARMPVASRYNAEEIRETVSDIVDLTKFYNDSVANLKEDQTVEELDKIFFNMLIKIISYILQDERDSAFIELKDSGHFRQDLTTLEDIQREWNTEEQLYTLPDELEE